LAYEDQSLEKNEYYQGEIFAMAGASFAHNQIVRNALSEIDQFLKDKNCRIFPSDLKVYIEANSLFTYPDLSIICDKPQFWGKRTDIITNPSVIIEVLSPATKDYDRGEKFMLYREIPTLKEYILISSTQMRLEQYIKQAPHEWKFVEYKLAGEVININTINYTTPLQTFYRDVDFNLAKEEVIASY
jgi:Uma2 family endonuclease